MNKDKNLVLNADDFGLSGPVNSGILACHAAGTVMACSLMVNMPGTRQAVDAAKTAPALDVGLHVNLGWGQPLSAPGTAPSLVGARGAFASKTLLVWRYATGRLRRADLEREIAAQIEAFLAFGLPLSHLDFHQHLNALPGIMDAAVAMARRYGVAFVRLPRERGIWPPRVPALRWALAARPRAAPRMDRAVAEFRGIAMTGRWTPSRVRRNLAALGPGLTEWMCHPGYADPVPGSPSRLGRERAVELEILKGPDFKKLAQAAGIRLTSFKEWLAQSRLES